MLKWNQVAGLALIIAAAVGWIMGRDDIECFMLGVLGLLVASDA